MTYITRVLPPEEWDRLAGTEIGPVVASLVPARTVVLVAEDDAGAIVGCWALLEVLHAEGVWIAPEHRGKAGVARRLVRAALDAARVLEYPTVVTGALTPEVERLLTAHLGATPVPGKQFVFATGG